MLKIALPLALCCAVVSAQTNSNITINATASATIPNLSGIVTSTPIVSGLSLIFPSGDVVVGQLSVPAGYLIPSLGQTT